MTNIQNSGWYTSLLLFTIRVLNILILPFDVKAFTVLGVEWALAKMYSVLYRDTKTEKGSNVLENELSVKQEENINRQKKRAVILDGTSAHGLALRKSLIQMGYTVIYPGTEEDKSDSSISIPIPIRNEESIDLFVKKVNILGSIDLLVVNSNQRSFIRSSIESIEGIEKKIVPSRKKIGFISKKELYKGRDRIILEKDRNARKNYLFNFLLIRGLSESMKRTSGTVVICVHRIFMLVKGKKNILPSYSFSYCNSQLFNVFLGIGAKTRYKYLDIRIVSSDFIGNRWIRLVENCLGQKRTDDIQYYNDMFPGSLDDICKDRANDIWENAEIIS